MGGNATSPVSNTTSGLVENYDVPDPLAVTPTTRWAPTGIIGGPFTETNTYTIFNGGTTSLNWTATKNQPWLALSATSGTLAAGTSTTVTASFTAAANGLAPGLHSDTITFTNTTSGLAQPRTVSLAVEPFTLSIFSENWEPGTLRSMWSTAGTGSHRTVVTNANSPFAGTFHLTMDSTTDGAYARNDATLTVNLAGRQKVQLRFWVKMFNDEADGPPPAPFTGGANFDGVAISADGTAWYEAKGLRTLSNGWERYVVDLDAAIAAHGLSRRAACCPHPSP